jgi:hypothetical protein
MSFDIVHNFIEGRVKALGYARSEQPFEFNDVPETQMGKTFILYPEAGELTDTGEELACRFHDTQVWNIKIAFAKSDMNDVINRNNAFRRIEAIIKDLDNPSNWMNDLRYLRYQSWEMVEQTNYFLIVIKILIQDTVTY